MLKQKSALSFIMNISAQFLGIVSVYFVSRYMGPTAMGTVSSALAFCASFFSFSSLGFGLAHQKRISEGRDQAECNTVYIVIKSVLIFIVSIVCLSSFLLIKSAGGKLPVPEDSINVFYIVLLSVSIAYFTRFFSDTFAARLEKAKEWSILISDKATNASLKVLFAIIGLGTMSLAYAQLGGVIVSLLVAIWLFRKLKFKPFNKPLLKDYSLFAGPAFIIGVSSSLAMQLDKVFINLLSNATEVGYYTAGQSLTRMISMLSVVFVSLLLPSYSKLNSQGNLEGIRNLSHKIEHYLSIPLFAIGSFLFFFSDQVQLIVLGSEFGPSSLIMKFLIINAVLLISAQPFTGQLMGMNKIVAAMIISILMLIMNIVFYFVFIPESFLSFTALNLGGAGAALSLLVSNFVGTTVFRYYAFKISGSKPSWRTLIKLLSGVSVFYFIHLLYHQINVPNNLFTLGLTAISGGLVYLLILFLTKQFTKEDLFYYLATVNPKMLTKYVKTELKD